MSHDLEDDPDDEEEALLAHRRQELNLKPDADLGAYYTVNVVITKTAAPLADDEVFWKSTIAVPKRNFDHDAIAMHVIGTGMVTQLIQRILNQGWSRSGTMGNPK